ncbi:MAG TPA: hypothetical protein VIC59_11680 [Gemmatimonadota bacterium]|jgi:hypothetical protein
MAGDPEPSYPAVDLSRLRTLPFRQRTNRVRLADFGAPLETVPDLAPLLASLPRVLAAEDLRAVAAAVAAAARSRAGVIVMAGGHVVKTGCSPYLIDLVQRGAVSHLALNGAAAIHDLEIALFGETSENVAETLADGSFGMAEETGREFNRALSAAGERGAGEALGHALRDAPHRAASLLAACYAARVPVTVHVTVGAEITHQHPACDGAAVGRTSHRDFRVLAQSLTQLRESGVVLNLGSAVVLPEVFVKALSVARNLGYPVRGFTAVDCDMIRHYRPAMNVVGRPVLQGGRGISLTGHHEILIPLLSYAIRLELGERPATGSRSST